jgi:S1-C subfamily serine protease
MLRAARVVSSIAVAVLLFASAAFGWPLEDMNRTVNQTNFILDNVCSATLISVKERLVVTNYHCVDDKITLVERDEVQPDGSVKKVKRERFEDVSLVQKGYKGFEQVGSAEYLAKIVAHRKTRDLAIVQIKADTIPHAVESKLLPEQKTMTRGEKVYAVGNPVLLDATISTGIISSLNRSFDVPWADNEKLEWIQFTAPITGGNSGGALYNDSGEFLGLPAAGYNGGGNLGFAVPVHYVRDLLKSACFESVYNASADDAKCREAKKKAAAKSEKSDEK